MPPIFPAQFGDARHEVGVAACKPVLVELDVVLEPGADVTAEFKAPMIDFELLPADSGSGPGRVRHQLVQLRNQKFQQGTARRQGIGDTHNELDLTWPLEQAAVCKISRVV